MQTALEEIGSSRQSGTDEGVQDRLPMMPSKTNSTSLFEGMWYESDADPRNQGLGTAKRGECRSGATSRTCTSADTDNQHSR